MSMQDSIADMFTRMRNAQQRLKPFTTCLSTKYKLSILDVLKREGYISGYETDKVGAISHVKIFLKYHSGKPVIEKIDKISKSSLPVYQGYDQMHPVCNGMGIRIVSTSEGVYSDRELRMRLAKENRKLGGTVIGEVI